MYARLGNYEKAKYFGEFSAGLSKELDGINSPSYFTAKSNLAHSYLLAGKLEESKKILIEVREKQLELLGNENPDFLKTTTSLADIYDALGNKYLAESYYRMVNNTTLKQIESSLTYSSEKERMHYYQTIRHRFDSYYQFSLEMQKQKPKVMATVFDYAINTKGLLYNSSQKMQSQILTSGDSSLRFDYENWKLKKASLAKAYGLPLEKRKKMGLDLAKMEAEINQLEKKLSQKSAEFTRNEEQGKLYTWKDAQSKLQPKEALVEILRIKTGADSVTYLALIVKKNTKNYPEAVILQNGVELEGKGLKYYQTTIKYKVLNELSYEAYWKPIAEKLAGIEKVYFAADGVYHKISLASLQNPQTNQYLLDEMEIHLLTNTKDLLLPRRERKPDRKIELFGNPNYSSEKSEKNDAELPDKLLKSLIESDTAQRFMNGGSIAPLPGTKIEVEKISAIASKSDFSNNIYTSEKATEAEVKQVQNPKVLHVATHGYFLEDAKTANFRIGNDDGRGEIKRIGKSTSASRLAVCQCRKCY